MRRPPRRLLRLASCLLLASDPAVAAAQPAPVTARLRWDAPPGCVDGPTLARAVALRLDRPVFDAPDPPGLLVVGRVEEVEPDSWRATLELRDGRGGVLGVRQLELASSRCHDLDDELAIVLALLVDQQREVTLRVPAPEAAPAGATDPPGPPGPPAAAPPPTGPPRDPSRAPGAARLAVRAGVALSVGDLPGAGLGPQATLAVPLGPWLHLEASGTLWVPTTYALTRGRVELWAWDAGLSACAVERATGWLSLGACAGARGGWFHATGAGYGASRAGGGPRAGADLGARAMGHLGPVDLVIDLRAGAPLLLNSLTVSSLAGTERVFEPGPLHLLAHVGIQAPWRPRGRPATITAARPVH